MRSAERQSCAVCVSTHGDQWRDVARRQADVARRAAADFEAAGDPGMAEMLRGHAEHLAHAATVPAQDGDK